MNSRKSYLDILKIFACFCVLADHSNYFVSTGGARINPGTVQYPIAFIYLTTAHVAVTLFVMISGALLLGKVYVNVTIGLRKEKNKNNAVIIKEN